MESTDILFRIQTMHHTIFSFCLLFRRRCLLTVHFLKRGFTCVCNFIFNLVFYPLLAYRVSVRIANFFLDCCLMRFTALTLSAVASAENISPALTCSEDIVRNAESQGFFSSIFNCIYGNTSTIGHRLCLAAFIADNATDNPSLELVKTLTKLSLMLGTTLIYPTTVLPKQSWTRGRYLQIMIVLMIV